jgi:tripartite-type tricarboxylate transporter receptor subunit TctC
MPRWRKEIIRTARSASSCPTPPAASSTSSPRRDRTGRPRLEADGGGRGKAGRQQQHRHGSVARSEPDGYTWLVTGPAALVNPTLYKDAGWDALKDLKCVGLAVWNQSVALVHPSMPASTIKEFVEIARKKPGELNFGNPGTGSSIDLSAQKLFQAATSSSPMSATRASRRP